MTDQPKQQARTTVTVEKRGDDTGGTHPWHVAIVDEPAGEPSRRTAVYGAKTRAKAELVAEGVELGLKHAGVAAQR